LNPDWPIPVLIWAILREIGPDHESCETVAGVGALVDRIVADRFVRNRATVAANLQAAILAKCGLAAAASPSGEERAAALAGCELCGGLSAPAVSAAPAMLSAKQPVTKSVSHGAGRGNATSSSGAQNTPGGDAAPPAPPEHTVVLPPPAASAAPAPTSSGSSRTTDTSAPGHWLASLSPWSAAAVVLREHRGATPSTDRVSSRNDEPETPPG
jgi:hypothetical protein